MTTAEQICGLLTELITKTSSMSEVCNAIMEIIRQEQESSYEVGHGEGERRGYERGYEEGRCEAMRNVDNNIIDHPSMSFYDKERLRRIVRTGSPY